MSASIVQLIDSSGSMTFSRQYEPAKTDAGTFIQIQSTGDYAGVVSFASTTQTVYALTQLTGQPVKDQISAALDSAAAIATNTNMKAGIDSAVSLFSGNAATHKAIVMLSDGMYNDGGDPLPGLETTIPIYTIALGPGGWENVLTDIANKTGGKYNYAPNAIQLATIYNRIIGETGIATLLANEQHPIDNFRYQQVTGTVGSGVSEATFVVNWIGENIRYTPTTPTPGEINVFLLGPNGETSSAKPVHVDKTYVVFRVPNPEAGTWTSVGWYRGSTTLQTAFGIFHPPTSMTLKVETTGGATPGEPVRLEAFVTDGGKPIRQARLAGSVDAPVKSFDAAMKELDDHLKTVEPDAAALDDGVSEAHARYATLSRTAPQLVAAAMIRERRPLPFREDKSGHFIAEFTDTAVPGSYVFNVNADGHSEHGTGPFSRTDRISLAIS
jgi:hypothetical protein